MRKQIMVSIAVVALNAISVFGREHPFLFMTHSDIERVRQNAVFNEEFEEFARIQINRAQRVRPGELSPFEIDWWKQEGPKAYVGGWDRAVTLKQMRSVPLLYSNAAKDCARAWILTGDMVFADKAKEILLKHSDYSFEFAEVNCGLDYTVASIGSMEAYDILYDRFTPQEHAKMKDFFMRLLAAVEKDDDYWVTHNPSGARMNNHEGWHRACMAMVGFFYEMPETIDRAITDPKGFEDMLRHGFHDDGLWQEGSLPYNFVQLNAMLFIAELAHNAGYPIDLYEYAIDDGLSLKRCYDVSFDLIFPDGLLPPVGDGYGGLHYPGERKDYELLYTRLGDPRYAWLINRSGRRDQESLFWGIADLPTTNPPPAVFSKLWLQHGCAALRTEEGSNYWNGEGWTLFSDFSINRSHSHAGKLSVMLFARNHLWLRDTECKPARREKFGSSVNQHLNWTTPSHNTVLIDFKSQTRTPTIPLDLVEYTILPDARRITMGDSRSLLYEGVRQLRTCIVRDGYVVDVFQVKSDQSHDISWAVHVDARPLECFKSDFEPARSLDFGPWTFIEQDDVSSERKIFWETFSHGGRFFRMDVSTSQPARYARFRYPVVEADPPETIPMRLITCHGDEALFAAVYRVSDEPITRPVEMELEPVMGDSWQLEIRFDGQSFKHRIARLEDLSPLEARSSRAQSGGPFRANGFLKTSGI